MRAKQRLLETNSAAAFSDLAPSRQGQMREESERSKLPALDFDPPDFFHQITTKDLLAGMRNRTKVQKTSAG